MDLPQALHQPRVVCSDWWACGAVLQMEMGGWNHAVVAKSHGWSLA